MKEVLPPDLPPGWQQVPLEGVIVRMSNGITKRQTKDGQGFAVSRIETISQGVVDFSRVGYLTDVSASEVENYRLHGGDILFSHINSDLHLGKTAVVSVNGDPLLHGMNLLLIRVDQRKVLPVFLHWLFNYYRVAGLFMSIAQHAVNQSSINQAKLKNLPIVLPPLDEQRQIVAEIEKQFTRLEAGVSGLRRVQANLKRYRAAVLKAACEGKLVPTEEVNEAPRRLQQIALGDVIESMKNGIYRPRNIYSDDGIACLRMYNIETGKIVWKDIKRMNLTSDEIREYQLLPGDLLVNRVNSRELVGKAAPIPTGLETCVFESKNIRVRLKRDVADPKFIGFAMSVFGPEHFNRNAQQVVGMASISQPQVCSLKIQLPPLPDQERIVGEVERRLSVVEELEAVVNANLQRATRLRQSILQRAFEGELLDEQLGLKE